MTAGGAPSSSSPPSSDAPPAPASKWRPIPSDPVELEKARGTVAQGATAILGITSALFANIPALGSRPLEVPEQALLRDPLELTLYRYAGDVDPAMALLIAVGMVVAGRLIAVKMERKAAGSIAEAEAALAAKPSSIPKPSPAAA